jgi:hypothetical protein
MWYSWESNPYFNQRSPIGRPRRFWREKLFAVVILDLVPRTRIELVMTGYQPIVIPFNYPGIFGAAGGIRTPISSLTWNFYMLNVLCAESLFISVLIH